MSRHYRILFIFNLGLHFEGSNHVWRALKTWILNISSGAWLGLSYSSYPKMQQHLVVRRGMQQHDPQMWGCNDQLRGNCNIWLQRWRFWLKMWVSCSTYSHLWFGCLGVLVHFTRITSAWKRSQHGSISILLLKSRTMQKLGFFAFRLICQCWFQWFGVNPQRWQVPNGGFRAGYVGTSPMLGLWARRV